MNLATTTLQSGFAHSSLNALRKRLLNFSSRNALLNYRHTKSKSIQIVENTPHHILERLQAGQALTFLAVPDPTQLELTNANYLTKEGTYPNAEKWATHLGMSTSFELPKTILHKKNQKSSCALQTLLYSHELEKCLHNLRSESESAIEETGTNILYLALGFLEWYENNTTKNGRLAPLFTLPIKLERNKLNKNNQLDTYSITLKDDSVLSNITLCEKIRQDFGLILPVIDEDEEIDPEQYFTMIEQIIAPAQPHWKVKRQASLILLNFTKQAMYQDLDPANWPDNARIEDHPIIKKLFSLNSTIDQNKEDFSTEYQIDKIETIHTHFPLIYDADSSQHSALIDVINGKNLVIEGPPGTGKSQTITNLIAASLNRGKKILFVAEKMAALNVVKSRLDHAGLGEFCLELHSQKSNKLKILNALTKQIEQQKHYQSPEQLDLEIQRYENFKTQLQKYVDLINSPWKQTGLSLYQILNKATRFRKYVPIPPEKLAITGLNSHTLTPSIIAEIIDNGHILRDVFIQISLQSPSGHMTDHYWYGVQRSFFLGAEEKIFYEQLNVWTQALENLQKTWEKLSQTCRFHVRENPTLETIQALAKKLCNLPPLHGDEIFVLLPDLCQDVNPLEEWLHIYREIHQKLQKCPPIFTKETCDNPELYPSILTLLTQLKTLGASDHFSLQLLSDLYQESDTITHIIQEINQIFSQIIPNIPAPLHSLFSPTLSNFEELEKFVSLIERLPAKLWSSRHEIFDSREIDHHLSHLIQLFERLMPLHQELTPFFDLERAPQQTELKYYFEHLKNAGWFKFFSSSWRQAKKAVLLFSVEANPQLNRLISLLPKLIQYQSLIEEINQIAQSIAVLQKNERGLYTPIQQWQTLRAWYQAVRKEYGTIFGDRTLIGETLLTLDTELAFAIVDIYKKNVREKIQKVVQVLQTLKTTFPAFIPLSNADENLLHSHTSIFQLMQILQPTLTQLKQHIVGNTHTLQIIQETTQLLKSVHDHITHMSELKAKFPFLAQNLNFSTQVGESHPALIASGQHTLTLAKALHSQDFLIESIQAHPTKEHYLILQEAGEIFVTALKHAETAQTAFGQLGQVDLSLWTGNKHNVLFNLIQRNQAALSHPISWLTTWTDYLRIREKLMQGGLTSLILALEENKLTPDCLHSAIQLSIYYPLAQEIFEQNQFIRNFNGMEQTAVQKKFQEYDKKLLNLQRQQIAYHASRNVAPAGIGSGRVANYTESALIQHEASKKTRHIAIRSLLDRASESIQALKPCLMMSPISVAQYLKPGIFAFDIVIMDEASQILPEDAIGVIARGAQIVIVGDPKQLPPTSFFQAAMNADNDDHSENLYLNEAESILDAVSSLFTKRRLRWHYRSRHESLIAFSNKYFYDSNLIIFPSPMQKSDEFGIRFKKIQGHFVNSCNGEEAHFVVQTALDMLLNHPDESIGIVAMNSQQRDEIERQFELAIKKDTLLQNAYEKNLSRFEPIFIKNLENVQGDERDVILISMTYGPATIGGRVFQRFGPINYESGWRRLNVLFTRAKKRMHIFSSMDAADIFVSAESNQSLRAFRAFLDYCETGHLHQAVHTGKAPDSDFEIAVMEALAKQGYECEPQLGIAGFFLDLAVKNPNQPGQFLMGIECDGATYHSAKSARDRDRLRQEILESLGWQIARIWSTDWFKNPEAQLQPILKRLNQLKNNEFCTSDDLKETSTQIEIMIEHTAEHTDIVQEVYIESHSEQPSNLQTELIQLREEIARENPEIPEANRILRPDMLHILIEQLPASIPEFMTKIPPKLRKATAPTEGQFIKQILTIISKYR